MSRPLLIGILAFLFTGLGQMPLLAQEKVSVTVLNASRVYAPRNLVAGKVYKRLKPALVDSRQVFAATPEYQKIQSERIRKGTAEYDLLVRAASTRFKNAVKRTMSLAGYDMVAETGAVTVEGKVLPDVTQEVIANLP